MRASIPLQWKYVWFYLTVLTIPKDPKPDKLIILRPNNSVRKSVAKWEFIKLVQYVVRPGQHGFVLASSKKFDKVMQSIDKLGIRNIAIKGKEQKSEDHTRRISM
jgi:hypothetical protein